MKRIYYFISIYYLVLNKLSTIQDFGVSFKYSIFLWIFKINVNLYLFNRLIFLSASPFPDIFCNHLWPAEIIPQDSI